jgi:SAM-dependent methyltransferase
MPTPVDVRVRTDALDPLTAADREWCASNCTIPWLEQTLPLEGKRVLEYGCGKGLVSRAFARRARSVLGLDIDAAAVREGQRELAALGIDNVELEAVAVDEILDSMRTLTPTVDVILFYAVLEHLTLDERFELLRSAKELARPGARIVCIETPNRLLSSDVHSSFLPYLTWLPDRLAVDYAERFSTRPDLLEQVRSERADGRELDWWVRYGRSASFHEFELVFGDIDSFIIAGGYDSVMFGARDLHPAENRLARDLAQQRPDLGPAWSRAWLDVVIAPDGDIPAGALVRPWTLETQASLGASYTRDDAVALRTAAATLHVSLPEPTKRLIVAFVCAPGPTELRLEPTEGGSVSIATNTDVAGRVRYVDVDWTGPVAEFELGLSTPGYVLFVGFSS